MKTRTKVTRRQYPRSQPAPGEMIFQTRHLRRDLHARLTILKARINGKLPTGAATVTLDVVLNRVVEAGLCAVEAEGV